MIAFNVGDQVVDVRYRDNTVGTVKSIFHNDEYMRVEFANHLKLANGKLSKKVHLEEFTYDNYHAKYLKKVT